MGQGYSLTSISAGAAALDASELADLAYEKSLGNAKFMKCIRARREDGVVVAKLAGKAVQNENWDRYVKALNEERRRLTDIPNTLGYHRIQQTSTAGILTRQFIYSSLYDRMSTRPFLDNIEKRWLAYQLLCAVRDSHAKDVFHGDIKSQNVLVTSWNWLYLTDFSSSYKPTYLPEDNPADFSFYFDTAGQRVCCLAPERLLRSGEDATKKGTINWPMDIFSVGCVIAELFLESRLFTLSTLLQYRAHKFDPLNELDKITDPEIREMVAHMIQLDPQSRYAADEYLNFWRGKAFPEYFSSFLHQYMYLVTDPTSGKRPITSGQENLGESDDRIDRVYNDFDIIANFLGYGDASARLSSHASRATIDPDALFPLQIDLPSYRHEISPSVTKPTDNGGLIFLTLIESSIRSTARGSPRIKAIELLLAFAEMVPDEVKLDRILPYLMDLISEDQTEPVRIYALRAMTQLLALVQTVSATNAYIFTEYILPRLRVYIMVPREILSSALRATYASCLSSLATTALRFLDMMQALRLGGTQLPGDGEANSEPINFTTLNDLHDNYKADVMTLFEEHTTGLLEDSDTSVRRAFLGSIATLCFAFGSAKASDVVLSHLNTYLNDRDWQLKCAFFETIVGVATYVGGAALEEFILPLMVHALTDPEETVIERVLRSFSSIAQLGLFQRATLWELVDITARFTMHPNTGIREAAAFFIASATEYLSVADRQGVIHPLIRHYLKSLPPDLQELTLLHALKKPLSRLVFEHATTWAQKTERGLFWKAAQLQHTFTFGGNAQNVLSSLSSNASHREWSRVPKNDEDLAWIDRLKSAGFTTEDEFKLVALRELIFRVANRKYHEDIEPEAASFNNVLTLNELKIRPHIVFFERDEKVFTQYSPIQGVRNRRKTIAEALQDAREDKLAKVQPDKIKLPSAFHEPSNSGVSTPGGIDIPLPKGLRSPTSGAQLASSADSRPSISSQHKHNLQNKGSTIGIIGGGKAKAEIGTTIENALGLVETLSKARELSSKNKNSAVYAKDDNHRALKSRRPAPHSYKGNDPAVLRLLDAMYLEHYPLDLAEFGPNLASRRVTAIKRASGRANIPWRPEGTLVAMLTEHSDSVTRIVVAPDHTFFITASDDGSIKVWDATRLERNATLRSRQTHKQGDNVKITSVNFIEDTHCFVSTGNDGSVHVVRVDYQLRSEDSQQSSPRYGRLRIIREHYFTDGEYVTWSEHYKDENKSVLMLATNKSRIVTFELRTMELLFELRNPVRHGVPLCLCIDKRKHWLLVGTTHGVLDLWDLRFRMRIKAFGFSGSSPINRLQLVPTSRARSRQMRVAIAGGIDFPEITVCDVERLSCTAIYGTGAGSKDINRAYKLLDIDDDNASGMLRRFNTDATSDMGMTSKGGSVGLGNSIRSIATGLNIWEGSEDRRYHFFLSAGPDWKVRYWDSSRPEASSVVSGMELEEGRPTYTITQPTPDLQIVTERLHPAPPPGSSGSLGSDFRDTPKNTPKKADKGSKADGSSSKPKSRSSVISMQAQVLLRSHLDTVMDVAFLEQPYGMVISCDRAGVVYVFA